MAAKERVVVIGGSSGMGLAIAQESYKLGYDVVIAGRSPEKLEKAKAGIGEVETHVLDIRKENEVSSFFSKIGSLDHLVVTAADFVMGPFLNLSIEAAKGFFDSKFWGQYCAAKYAAPKMKKGGSIVFFCGLAGQKPFANFAAGSAINAAIEGLTRALALDLAPLRVNAISPGTIVTPVWDTLPEKAKMEEFKKVAERLPVKRVGMPEDIAKAAIFLMQCGYATGTVVYVDGGDKIL